MLQNEKPPHDLSTLRHIISPQDLTILLIIGIIFFVHSTLFSDWIVDDAAISFVYAANLATGHGLVSQPGLPPVEGYSNFAWIMVLAPFFALNVFHPLIVPKLLGIIFVFGTFILVLKLFREVSTNGIWVPTCVLLLLAMNTPFVIWTTSGMENALYVFLLTIYLLFLVYASHDREQVTISPLIGGIVAGLIALTRPEGILYAVAYPICLFLFVHGSIISRFQMCFRRVLTYGIVVGMIVGGYVLFRWLYFHDIFPMPYYAKNPKVWEKLTSVLLLDGYLFDRLHELASGFGGSVGMWVFVFTIATTLYLIIKGRFKKQWAPFGILAAISIIAFVLLLPDWMREYRFGTFFFVVWYSYVALLINDLIHSTKWSDRVKRALIISVSVVAIALSAFMFSGRSLSFAGSPTLPMRQVERILGYKLNEYARLFQVKNGSVLTPDVGGALYASELRVHDLGGLLDPYLAKNVFRKYSLPRVYDYLFNRMKPTFLFIHGHWTSTYKLESDARFGRDYVPLIIFRYGTAGNPKGSATHSGLYIRKDAVRGKPVLLAMVRKDVLPVFQNTRWDF